VADSRHTGGTATRLSLRTSSDRSKEWQEAKTKKDLLEDAAQEPVRRLVHLEVAL
jgi:hypothetical protein